MITNETTIQQSPHDVDGNNYIGHCTTCNNEQYQDRTVSYKCTAKCKTINRKYLQSDLRRNKKRQTNIKDRNQRQPLNVMTSF